MEKFAREKQSLLVFSMDAVQVSVETPRHQSKQNPKDGGKQDVECNSLCLQPDAGEERCGMLLRMAECTYQPDPYKLQLTNPEKMQYVTSTG